MRVSVSNIIDKLRDLFAYNLDTKERQYYNEIIHELKNIDTDSKSLINVYKLIRKEV